MTSRHDIQAILDGRSIEGEHLHDDVRLQFAEFVTYCHVERSVVTQMVDVGVLEPKGDVPEEWCFAARDLRRVRTAQRLARDLGINYEGAAVILDLLDERDSILARLHALQLALSER